MGRSFKLRTAGRPRSVQRGEHMQTVVVAFPIASTGRRQPESYKQLGFDGEIVEESCSTKCKCTSNREAALRCGLW